MVTERTPLKRYEHHHGLVKCEPGKLLIYPHHKRAKTTNKHEWKQPQTDRLVGIIPKKVCELPKYRTGWENPRESRIRGFLMCFFPQTLGKSSNSKRTRIFVAFICGKKTPQLVALSSFYRRLIAPSYIDVFFQIGGQAPTTVDGSNSGPSHYWLSR